MSKNKVYDHCHSIETQKLYGFLLDRAPGELVTYNQLSEVIGRDVRERRDSLRSAREKLQKTRQIVFSVVRGVGLEKLDSKTKGNVLAKRAVQKTHRTAKRENRRLLTSYSNEELLSLSQPQLREHNTAIAVTGVVAHITEAEQVKRIERKQQNSEMPLAIAGTLNVLMNG